MYFVIIIINSSSILLILLLILLLLCTQYLFFSKLNLNTINTTTMEQKTVETKKPEVPLFRALYEKRNAQPSAPVVYTNRLSEQIAIGKPIDGIPFDNTDFIVNRYNNMRKLNKNLIKDCEDIEKSNKVQIETLKRDISVLINDKKETQTRIDELTRKRKREDEFPKKENDELKIINKDLVEQNIKLLGYLKNKTQRQESDDFFEHVKKFVDLSADRYDKVIQYNFTLLTKIYINVIRLALSRGSNGSLGLPKTLYI